MLFIFFGSYLDLMKLTNGTHFFWPQGSHISGKNGRVHCSLNINTETGRLSARRPNLQVLGITCFASFCCIV